MYRMGNERGMTRRRILASGMGFGVAIFGGMSLGMTAELGEKTTAGKKKGKKTEKNGESTQLPDLPRFKKNTVSVYLSPSTQEGNHGADDYGTEERRMNEVCDRVEKRLKACGVTVFRNRPEMSLREVVADSNERKVNLHFAIHSNGFNGKVRGTECYCYRFGGEGERLATKVYEQLCEIYDGPRRGVKESADHFGKGKPLYETANTTAPAALVEIAFHDQPDDAKWMLEHQDEIAERLAAALLLHLSQEHPESVR